MVVSEGTRRKLENLRSHLRSEFPHLPAAQVEQTLEDVVGALLAEARFDDFVPLLAHRRASERLHDEAAEVADLEPATA